MELHLNAASSDHGQHQPDDVLGVLVVDEVLLVNIFRNIWQSRPVSPVITVRASAAVNGVLSTLTLISVNMTAVILRCTAVYRHTGDGVNTAFRSLNFPVRVSDMSCVAHQTSSAGVRRAAVRRLARETVKPRININIQSVSQRLRFTHCGNAGFSYPWHWRHWSVFLLFHWMQNLV